ncbi:restriction endonuclease subunit S [Peptoniphilus obesi]|uniref:restriction endonuclease subunit S n=1 Tax=Peptoniphilus obesi TaxID=1472765 RepID=UPI0004B8A9F5|nr:restriction endonuclease subunit S [Peptoniphilus obesi]
MSKIDELLKNEKVEWKKLGEIGQIYGGITGRKKEDFVDGNAKFITYKNVYSNPATELNVEDKVRIGKHENQRKLKYGDILFTGSSETADECGMSSVITNELKEDVYLNSFCFFLRLNNSNLLLPNFAKHLFRSINLRKKIIKTASGVTRFNVSKDLMKKVEIPIPSIETQEKIVKILDNFTEYVTELQAELQNRTKQYEYYRDDLLSEDSLKKLSDKLDSLEDKEYELENLRLEDIVKIKNGKDWKKLNKGNIPVYGSGGYMDVNVDKCSYDKPSVLIPRKGSIENVFYLDKAFWNVDTIFYTEIDESKIIPKYFYYFMKTVDLNALSTNTTRPSLTQDILNKIKINLPPLEVQSKVVEVLDKFQNLLSETQGLLPKEIEERQKQYEYYREKLLTFEDISDFKASKQ